MNKYRFKDIWLLDDQVPELTQQLYVELRGYEYLGVSASFMVLLLFWGSVASNLIHLLLILWLILMCCLYLYQWKLLREGGPELAYETTERWAPKNRVMAFLIALGWAALAPLLLWQIGPWHTVALVLLLFAVLSMPVSAYSNDYPAAVLSVCAIAVPTFISLLARQSIDLQGPHLLLAAVFSFGAFLCLVSGHRLARTRRRAVKEQNELAKAKVSITSIESTLRLERETDPQTGLGNRPWFEGYLKENYHDDNRPYYLVALNLDNFTDVTSTIGRHAADFVLQDLAGRLSHPEGHRQLAARGDHGAFLILYEGRVSGTEIEETVSHLYSLAGRPFIWQGQPLNFSCSLGVAGGLSDDTSASLVVENALLSMREASNVPGNSFCIHDLKLQDKANRQAVIRRELASVTERGELFLALQPKVELATGKVFSAEALLRWEHPKLGFMSPADFIPLAESTGAIIPVGRWVIEEATRLLLESDLPPGFSIAVNVSVLQFKDPELVQTLRKSLDQLAGTGQKLEIEITESAVMDDAARVHRTVRELIKLGVRIALDDFGTGYSSLACITQLPLHTLKLDKSFIDSITSDRKQATLVNATIRGAALLDVDLVAEGVETREQCQLLHDFGCRFVQGYYFARPMIKNEFSSWVRKLGGELCSSHWKAS
ncbi:putative bifunctional diguanylate cyclase/phosphodiesterase [Marinobacter sp. F3R08]|uniref:putative bifunctional diguanylate cyclase/phosphodiesterase n=1 Tax=Marinobacter sp. F3R08 TaxID=2841559 RepID=UPI001C085FCC|nr:GGDEF domain-containing phosphodiesterase [Marinobacter sp. F3R08]MBU2953521.1 EAL domain-containing protein [Marinobacter sp. F3R08]